MRSTGVGAPSTPDLSKEARGMRGLVVVASVPALRDRDNVPQGAPSRRVVRALYCFAAAVGR